MRRIEVHCPYGHTDCPLAEMVEQEILHAAEEREDDSRAEDAER